MQQDFSRAAGDARAWLADLPAWAALSPVGHVTGYWRWTGKTPSPAANSSAAWGYRAGFGGHGEFGVLGASFEPHEYPYLRVGVATTLKAGPHAEGRFRAARVGLPLEYVGGVLAGALQEPERLGPGTLTFEHAAFHDVDSSWEVFRILAVGVVRLLGLPSDNRVPADLLPRFGGAVPASPGAD